VRAGRVRPGENEARAWARISVGLSGGGELFEHRRRAGYVDGWRRQDGGRGGDRRSKSKSGKRICDIS